MIRAAENRTQCALRYLSCTHICTHARDGSAAVENTLVARKQWPRVRSEEEREDDEEERGRRRRRGLSCKGLWLYCARAAFFRHIWLPLTAKNKKERERERNPAATMHARHAKINSPAKRRKIASLLFVVPRPPPLETSISGARKRVSLSRSRIILN